MTCPLHKLWGFDPNALFPLKLKPVKRDLKYYKSPRSPKACCLSIWWRKNLGAPGSTRKEATGPKTPSKQRKTTPKRISRRSSSSKDLPDIEENRHHHHQRQEENRPAPDPHATQHQGDLDPELALDVVLDAPHPLNLVADLALLSVVVSFDVKDPPVRGDNPASVVFQLGGNLPGIVLKILNAIVSAISIKSMWGQNHNTIFR